MSSGGNVAPSFTFNPVTVAPFTALLPLDVRLSPTSSTPFQVMLPLIVRLPVTISVPCPSPGSAKFPCTRMVGQ